jgi:hypothetical protein
MKSIQSIYHLVSSRAPRRPELCVTGYSILQADNLAGAKEMLKKHPDLKWTDGCAIEIHEMVAM